MQNMRVAGIFIYETWGRKIWRETK